MFLLERRPLQVVSECVKWILYFFCSKSCFDHIVLAERIKPSLKIIESGDTEITVKSMKGILRARPLLFKHRHIDCATVAAIILMLPLL